MKILNFAITLIIFAITLIVFAIIPTSVTVPYQKLENYQEQYTETEAYQVQVPYDTIEYYTEKEPYKYTKNVETTTPYNVNAPYDSSIIRLLKGTHYTYTSSLGGLINTSHINTDIYFGVLNNEKQSGMFTVTTILSPNNQNEVIGVIMDIAGLTQGIPGVGSAIKALIPKEGEIKMSNSTIIRILFKLNGKNKNIIYGIFGIRSFFL